MLRNSIPGMDKVIDDDPPRGTTILVMGDAGTLKSAFVFNVACNYLTKNPTESGTYITLDEKRESYLRNMKSLGIAYTDRLLISDIAAFRTDFQKTSDVPVDSDIYFDQITHMMLENVERKTGKYPELLADRRSNSIYVLDSINAFLAIAQNNQYETSDKSGCYYSLRNKLFALLSMLRENNAINYLIFETTGDVYRPEFFLVDGIIELGTVKYKDELKRYLQIKKMKGIKHRLDRFLIDTTPTGLEIVSRIIP
jgi:KaiC/GvpD/RAD55 family RecA-like ATPase